MMARKAKLCGCREKIPGRVSINDKALFSCCIEMAGEVIPAIFNEAYMSGRLPFHQSHSSIDGVVRDKSAFTPEGGAVIRSSVSAKGGRVNLFEGDARNWLAIVAYYPTSFRASVEVVAETQEIATQVYLSVIRQIETEAEESEDPGIVRMTFWSRTPHGYNQNTRKIEARSWSDIRANYPPAAVTDLDRLAKMTPEAVRGKIILLNGEPGTGKTTFLSTISREWKDWCDTHYILDPEVLWSDPGYITETMLSSAKDQGYGSAEIDPDAMEPWERALLTETELAQMKADYLEAEKEIKDKYSLIILEDTGELISAGAKKETGQGFARLLNVADGILGQGTRVLIAITTNEPLGALHAAVTRPGRCLAQIEINPMTPSEAQLWAGPALRLENRSYTLAELIGIRNGDVKASGGMLSTGQYL